MLSIKMQKLWNWCENTRNDTIKFKIQAKTVKLMQEVQSLMQKWKKMQHYMKTVKVMWTKKSNEANNLIWCKIL